MTFRTAARAFAVSHTPSERCLVVGDADACDRLRLKLADSPHANSHVLGYVPFKDRIRADDPAPLGWLTRLEEVVRANDVHRVIVAPRDPDSHALLDAVRRVKALGAKISILPGILEVVGSSVEFDDVEGMTVLGVRRFGLSRASRAIKRTLDIGGAVGTLLAGAPFMLVTAVAIKVDSGGPIFFRQTRMGRDDETFEIVKFRTMHDGAERHQADLLGRSATEELFKVPGDPRITRVGRWLRRTSLDELPQLFNVLRGEMSLVGPRPLVLAEDSRVEGWHRRRLHLKPGMTGPWQVLTSGRIPLYEMVKIDYRYASSWTLWNDVKILIQTFFYVTARRGM